MYQITRTVHCPEAMHPDERFTVRIFPYCFSFYSVESKGIFAECFFHFLITLNLMVRGRAKKDSQQFFLNHTWHTPAIEGF
jgi:hypothetical protein